MEHVYLVQHVYQIDGVEEVKLIGVFSTRQTAEEVIEQLWNQPGFNRFPKESFEISKLSLNEYSWKEGFISWDDADKGYQV